MGISEKKMQIIINNYFEQECDVNTSIREAFEKGFRIGVKKISSIQQEWIPCSEPPTENDSYFVWMPFAPKGHHITVAEWCSSYWNIKTLITVWMPIPESWKEYKEK